MARIAVGGFQHETNTFAPLPADYAAFERADAWPPLARGEAMLAHVDGVHLPVTGALRALGECRHEVVPLLWCSATPSGEVTRDAFERIVTLLIEDLDRAGPVDGCYLDLHGAMVCEHLADGDGEILARVRAALGPDVPIAVSLDLHANLSEAMVEHADAIDVFRTYPHVDMAETGARTVAHLDALLRGDGPWHAALRRTDFLIPLNWGCTLVEPARWLYESLPARVGGEVRAVSFACGFPLADVPDAGPGVVAYARSQRAADNAADALIGEVAAREPAFAGALLEPGEAVAEARRLARPGAGPVVLADTQDNPGGGGAGDTVGLLRALVEGGARGAVVATIADPHVAAAAHRAGIGAVLDTSLGERSGLPGHRPLSGQYEVLALGSGRFTGTGPMYLGARMDFGPMALLEIEGVRVLVASSASQVADRSILRHLGIEPAEEGIIAVKSSVHFRADFQPIASHVLVVRAPGPVTADTGELEFHRLRPGLRQRPRAK